MYSCRDKGLFDPSPAPAFALNEEDDDDRGPVERDDLNFRLCFAVANLSFPACGLSSSDSESTPLPFDLLCLNSSRKGLEERLFDSGGALDDVALDELSSLSSERIILSKEAFVLAEEEVLSGTSSDVFFVGRRGASSEEGVSFGGRATYEEGFDPLEEEGLGLGARAGTPLPCFSWRTLAETRLTGTGSPRLAEESLASIWLPIAAAFALYESLLPAPEGKLRGAALALSAKLAFSLGEEESFPIKEVLPLESTLSSNVALSLDMESLCRLAGTVFSMGSTISFTEGATASPCTVVCREGSEVG
mmetsp:Transcript_27022/g.44082  ORF Transcript_27022/g.44082 Transcript_27022/m.44082 type:complete len:305 (-) Transcript_27022:2712-3626(-)